MFINPESGIQTVLCFVIYNARMFSNSTQCQFSGTTFPPNNATATGFPNFCTKNASYYTRVIRFSKVPCTAAIQSSFYLE
jgi:hypothetical protein